MTPQTPLEEALETFLRFKHNLSVQTANAYRKDVKQYIKWVSPQRLEARLYDLEPNKVNNFLTQKRREGHQYAAHNIGASLKTLGKWLAEDWNYNGGVNPLQAIKVPRRSKEPRSPFNDVELKKIIEVASQTPNWARDRALVLLMAGSGLRFNEARELTLGMVDLGERVVTVLEETSKSKRTRQVRLDPIAGMALEQYIRQWRPGPYDPKAPVFLTVAGKKLTYQGFHHIFQRLAARLEAVGITDFKPHRLRHTWATNYHRVGAGTVFDLQNEGGWKDLNMARQYTKGRPMEELKRLPTALSGLIRTGKV